MVVCVALLTMASDAQSGRKTYAFVHARIMTVTHGTIEHGTVVISQGRITAIGADVQAPAGAEVIDCSGLVIYPGLIDAGTRLGLVEIGSIAEARDDDEVGDITPQVQALTAVNPSATAIPVTRVNGVTTALTAPDGGLFPGTAALINLYGYTPEQMQVGGFRGVVMNFPSSGRDGWWDKRSDEEIATSTKKARADLDDIWEQALLYSRIDSAYRAGGSQGKTPEYVPEIQALVPVVRGEVPLLIEVNAARDIDSALGWVKGKPLRAIFTGVAEGWRVADRIAAADIPCIVGPVLTLPSRSSDRYDKPYANPALLRYAGVKVAIRSSETANARNLPFHAGYAAAYGMGTEEALRAITIVPAEMFGVDSLVGSLEVGKQATLFVADGDPFEPATTIQHLFIEGYPVPLQSRQVELYREFIKREPGLRK